MVGRVSPAIVRGVPALVAGVIPTVISGGVSTSIGGRVSAAIVGRIAATVTSVPGTIVRSTCGPSRLSTRSLATAARVFMARSGGMTGARCVTGSAAVILAAGVAGIARMLTLSARFPVLSPRRQRNRQGCKN